MGAEPQPQPNEYAADTYLKKEWHGQRVCLRLPEPRLFSGMLYFYFLGLVGSLC